MKLTGFDGKIAAITGGGGVIGTSFASGLAEAGVKVAILDLELQKAQDTAKQVGEGAIGIQCDVLNRESVIEADREIEDKLGQLSFLVNCAGGNNSAATSTIEKVSPNLSDLSETFFGIDMDAFKQTLDLNLIGTVLPCSVLAKRLCQQGGGAIVNISSMNAFRPLTRIPAYSAGKSAVTNFTEWLAVHLAPTGVRVNAIAPGFFLTEQLKYLAYDSEGKLTPRYERVLANTPMGRFGDPDELLGTLFYLLSDGSKFVTGVTIPVDGGFNAYSGV